MKSAIWLPSSTQEHQVPLILPLSGLQSVSLSTLKGLVLSDSSEVHELELESFYLKRIGLEVQVSQVFCYFSVCLLVGSGQAFIFGQDDEKTGLLGEETSELLFPKRVEVPTCIIKGALSQHAALVDLNKNLFTWGRGLHGQLGWSDQNESRPSMIDTQNLFLTSDVVCGKNFTAVLTDGGFVNVFGSLDNHLARKTKGKILPFSQTELDRITCVQVAAGTDFVLVLTENKEVFAFDSCLELVKLPSPQGIALESIACTWQVAFALGEGEIVEWRYEGNAQRQEVGITCHESKCELTLWSGVYYKLNEPYTRESKIFSSSSDYCVMTFQSVDQSSNNPQPPSALFSKQAKLKPYARSNLLRKNSLQSSRFKGKSLALDEGLTSLQRLYSLGNDENTAAKIKKFRRDHDFTKSLDEIIQPAVLSRVSFAFRCVKEKATMRKHLEKHLAVAMIVPQIEKLLNKRLMTCYVLAFRAVFLFSKEKKERIVKKSQEFLEVLQNKEEKLRNLQNVIRNKYIKHLFFAFTLVKDLEMRRLQKQTAVLSVVQVLGNSLKGTKRKFLKVLSVQVYSLKTFQKSMTHLLLLNLKKVIFCIFSSSKHQIIRSNTLNKAVKDVVKKLKTREIKHQFLKWKKKSELIKTSSMKKQFSSQIACKSLFFAISSSVIRSTRQVLTTLKHFHRLDLKSAGLALTRLFKSLTLSKKRKILKTFQVLLKQFKSLQILFKSSQKLLKKLKRSSFKQVELFSLTSFKEKILKSLLFLQLLLTKMIQKRFQSTFLALKNLSKDKTMEMTGGPSYSFFSPKLQKQSSGILRNKKTNSVAFLGQDLGPNNDFAFNTFQRLRKQNSFTSSFNLNSPKALFTSTSSTDTFLGKFAEASLLEKTLKQRKVTESTMKLIKKTAKPPLKPPWKPTSSTASTQKIMINSTIRRSQYDLKLKERVKSHSKHGSTDASVYTSTPTIPSRASSRQKISKKRTFDTFDSITANFKFAVLILDNFRLNLINRRMFESWCRIKYFLKSSPKPPAPNPSDPGIYMSPSSSQGLGAKMTWQDNLYVIGFESLKHLARVVIGRQILEGLREGNINKN